MSVTQQTRETLSQPLPESEALAKVLDPIIIECEILSTHTALFHSEARKVKDEVQKKGPCLALQDRIKFLHDFAETDRQIYQAMFVLSTSAWSVESQPNRYEVIRKRNNHLLSAIESIEKSDATIGRRALTLRFERRPP